MWVSLGDALEMAREAGMIDGDEAAATASVSLKKPASTEVPAVVGRRVNSNETTQPGTKPTSPADGRGRATHSPAPPQRRVARPMLSVIIDNGPHFRPPRRHAPALRVASNR